MLGGSSYSSARGAGPSVSSNTTVTGTHQRLFPQNQYRSFDLGDPNVILGKLKEFNQKAGNNSVDEVFLEDVIQLCSRSVVQSTGYEILFNLLNWSDGKMNCD